MHTVYVLKSEKDGNLYVGCTSDITKRLQFHNKGSVRSTKNRRPLILIYSEEYRDRMEAFQKERYYKTGSGKKSLKSKFE